MKKSVVRWNLYKKTGLQEMRPYVQGEDLSNVSVSAEDTPEAGGMIARNKHNPKDQWYVAKDFFEKNYEMAGKEPLFLVFDVESVGLHGVGFAVGGVVVDTRGRELASFRYACPLDTIKTGREEDLAWVRANVKISQGDAVFENINLPTPAAVRAAFWELWLTWKDEVMLSADCPWPVESRFLCECVDEAISERNWQGPYPIIDVASVRLAADLDPLGEGLRKATELPIHDPLADSRQSARLLLEALKRG